MIIVLFIVLCVLGIAASIVYNKVNTKIKTERSTCPSCKKQYSYQDDVAWEVTSQQDYTDKQTVTVEFACTCRHCGEVKSFSKTYTTAKYIQGKKDAAGRQGPGHWEQYKLEKLVRESFL